MPDEPEALGLLALMLLHDSRRDARVACRRRASSCSSDQDRSRWDTAAIDEGRELVERALRMRRVGPYQLQAAIAALHAEAGETDWPQIVALYGELAAVRAVAGRRAEPRGGGRDGRRARATDWS